MIWTWMESDGGMIVCFGVMAVVLVLSVLCLIGCCVVSGQASEHEEDEEWGPE